LRARLGALLERPLRAKDADVEALLMAGIYQIRHMEIPVHAAVSSSVDAARELGKPWACPLVNGVLRNAVRQVSRDDPVADESVLFDHPQWMIDRIRSDWPHQWEAILRAGNDHAPMTLRVNLNQTTVDEYRSRLADAGIESHATGFSPVGLRLGRAVPVTALPEFEHGWASVQDEAAQLAAQLIAPRAGERVLDACAAPGGKTGHLLESATADLRLLALEKSASRMKDVDENLKRLGLRCEMRVADAGTPDKWWDGEPFDAILLDAPCTAVGVIRRHPDIRLHRRPEDIANLAQTQQRLLQALWPLLRAGGRFLYATCSIIPGENDDSVGSLIEAHGDVRVSPLQVRWGGETRYGRQILPGEDEMDGFYYALLIKDSND
jgi:16S rRNA (cytosine967-C5)-methyltransferase